MARVVVSDLTSFLASNGSVLTGMLFVAAVIAATLIMTAQSNQAGKRESGPDR
jgi:hypothetical protein